MKKLVNVVEVEGEGLNALLGQRVTLFCLNYFYTGVLEGVNDTCVLLNDASIVYETGSFTKSGWETAQSLKTTANPQGKWYVGTSTIESFGILK